MAQRIIKNFTDQKYSIKDLGDVEIPSKGAVDLGGDEARLIQLSSSENLLQLISMGIDKIRVSDGVTDFSFSEGIDIIRRIEQKQERDNQGRAVFKNDNRRKDYDSVFQGSGDDLVNGVIGGGASFVWDFIDETGLIAAPDGFLRKRIDLWILFIQRAAQFSATTLPKGLTSICL